jgi:hypothetical protein
MDGPQFNGNFYCDTKPPFYAVSDLPITLTGSYQPVVSAGALPWMPPNYFTPGKLLYMRMMFQCTSQATPGAIFFQVMLGDNTANNGQSLVNVGLNWTANNSNVTSTFECWMKCRASGVSGSILTFGTLFVGGTGIIMVPPSGPGSVTIDTTQSGYLSTQVNRSGSTGETFQFHDIFFRAMN